MCLVVHVNLCPHTIEVWNVGLPKRELHIWGLPFRPSELLERNKLNRYHPVSLIFQLYTFILMFWRVILDHNEVCGSAHFLTVHNGKPDSS